MGTWLGTGAPSGAGKPKSLTPQAARSPSIGKWTPKTVLRGQATDCLAHFGATGISGGEEEPGVRHDGQ